MPETDVAQPSSHGGSSRGRLPMSLVCALLLIATVGTAFAVVYTAHRSRELFQALEQARRDENEIQIEWRQLLLERSTLSSHARVEAIAGQELKMVPVNGELRMVVVE